MQSLNRLAAATALALSSILGCTDAPTSPHLVPIIRSDAAILPGSHVLSIPTDGTPVNVAVQQWASDISNDCSSSVSAVIMPGKYLLNQEIKIADAPSCGTSRTITIAAYTSFADTLFQTGVWAHDSSGHYDEAVNVFHVSTPNVTISDNVIASNGLPGNDSVVYAGAGVRFEGSGASYGSVLNNHIYGMQSSGVDTYGASYITVSNNTISCTPLGGGSRAGHSMGVNVRGDGTTYASAHATVYSNTVSDCSDEAILVESTSAVRITYNDVECYVTDCGYGISLLSRLDGSCNPTHPTSGIYVGYNTLNSANIRNPILTWGSGPTQSDTVEENNVNGAKTTSVNQNSTSADGRGINLTPAVEPHSGCTLPTNNHLLRRLAVVHNNRVQQTAGYGIYIGGDSTQLYGNYVDHANNGLVVEQDADYPDIQSGQYTYNQMGLVVRAHVGAYIYGNGMYHNSQWGACVWGTYTVPWNDYASNTFGNLTRWTTGSGC
jgi:hypothetical protein